MVSINFCFFSRKPPEWLSFGSLDIEEISSRKGCAMASSLKNLPSFRQNNCLILYALLFLQRAILGFDGRGLPALKRKFSWKGRAMGRSVYLANKSEKMKRDPNLKLLDELINFLSPALFLQLKETIEMGGTQKKFSMPLNSLYGSRADQILTITGWRNFGQCTNFIENGDTPFVPCGNKKRVNEFITQFDFAKQRKIRNTKRKELESKPSSKSLKASNENRRRRVLLEYIKFTLSC